MALGCRVDGPPPLRSTPPTPPADIAAPAAAEPVRWTLEFPGANLQLRELVPTDAGGVRLAGTFTGTLSIPGFEPRAAHGGADIVVLTISARGHLDDVKTFGSDGEDDLHSVHGSLVSVRAFGTWALGDDVIVPSQQHSELAPPPSTSVVVDVENGLQRIAAVDGAHRSECWPLADGSALLAAFFDDAHAPAMTRLERHKNGALVWSATLPDVEATAMIESDSGLWLATRRPRVLTVQRVDPTTGTISEPNLLLRPGFDDLGSIIALSPEGHAWGHSSGPPRAGLSHAARPFFATQNSFTPLLDATAMVLDVDTPTGDVLVHVLHPRTINGEGAEVSEAGVYLLHDGVPAKLTRSPARGGVLTPTHVVVVSPCESGPCVQAVGR